MALRVEIAAVLLVAGVPMAASCAGTPSAPAASVPVHPVVHGAAGPFRQVTVTLVGSSDGGVRGFSGRIDTAEGRHIALAGPDEPADLFVLEPQAVLFTPIDRTRANGVIILYNSSQLGPQHGTDHRALVYRVSATAAVRQPAIEARLDGATTAAAARARLAAIRR